MEHNEMSDEERRNREAALDETLAESFPASDAPSTLPNPDDHSLPPPAATPAPPPTDTPEPGK